MAEFWLLTLTLSGFCLLFIVAAIVFLRRFLKQRGLEEAKYRKSSYDKEFSIGAAVLALVFFIPLIITLTSRNTVRDHSGVVTESRTSATSDGHVTTFYITDEDGRPDGPFGCDPSLARDECARITVGSQVEAAIVFDDVANRRLVILAVHETVK